jgi:hypothetical protein
MISNIPEFCTSRRLPSAALLRVRNSSLLRALDKEEDGVSSAFLTGKQNGIFFEKFITHL